MSSPQSTARLAGFLYVLMMPFGIYGTVIYPSILIEPGNAAATASNILASEHLFRLGIVSALTVQTLLVFVVLVLYRVLKPVNKNVAKMMVALALVGVPIIMLNELNQYGVLVLLSGTDYLSAFDIGQLQALSMFLLELHASGILIAEIFWGLWLFPMGYLVFKSGFVPRIFGILLILGCGGYLYDVVTHFLFPGLQIELTSYTGWGELLFPIWLLIRGVNVEKWQA
jgi:hypothetical protein